jgi:polyferredoxin
MSTLEALPRVDRHQPRCGVPRRSRRFRWRVVTWILVHVAALVHVAHWKVAGRTLTPVEPSEAMQTLELGYVNAGFLLFLFTIVATLVLGRFFCGWACHLVAYQDLCAWLLRRLGCKPRPLRVRLLALVPFVAAFEMFVRPTLMRWLEGRSAPELSLHLTTEQFWATFPGPWMAALTFLVDGALLVWWLGAKGFCTHGCPYGAVFAVADRFATGRIRVTDACEGCGHCTATCTSNVRVHEEVARHRMVVDPRCMKCMDCVDVCPKQALYFGFGPPAVKAAPRRAYDFTWKEELGAALVCVGGILAFRDLYHRVPFLLALGLGVLLAFAALTLWRLVRRPSFVLQHFVLRDGGRWTREGRVAVALIGAFLLFAAHSAAVRWHGVRGERLLAQAVQTPREQREQRSHLVEDSERLLQRAESLGLFADPMLEFQLGSIAFDRGRREEAERRFERALQLEPGLHTAARALRDLRR